jgi:hypothetical protein
VDALRLLYCVDGGKGDGGERKVLSEALFRAYWVEGRDVADRNVLLEIAKKNRYTQCLNPIPPIFYQPHRTTRARNRNRIGSVSVYEYARCTTRFSNITSTGSSSNSTYNESTTGTVSPSNEDTGSSGAPPGFPAPVSTLDGTDAWGFFLDGADDVAVLAFTSFSTQNSNPIDPGSLTPFLEIFSGKLQRLDEPSSFSI